MFGFECWNIFLLLLSPDEHPARPLLTKTHILLKIVVYKFFGYYLKRIIFVHYNVHKFTCFMVVISSAELRNNMKKYLDIAKNEKVVIQRGRNETFVLVAQKNADEEDLNRAITVDDVLARVREGLNEMFERKEGHNIA